MELIFEDSWNVIYHKLEKKLRKSLDEERFVHTQGVMYTAGALAMAHGEPLEQALIAGLLHDCAKGIPNGRKLELCLEHQIDISPTEEQCPTLLHAKLGAYLAKEQYGITDPAILHAIQVHTTGAPGMNQLDKMIYIADYIEPNRDKAPNLATIRTLAFKDLDTAMIRILRDTLDYLEAGGGQIDPMTQRTYQYFKEL